MIELNFKNYIEFKYQYIGVFHDGRACGQNQHNL